MLSLFDDITKKEKQWQQQLTMAIYPFQYPDYKTVATDATTGTHASTSLGTHVAGWLWARISTTYQVDGTKLKDLEFQFLHRSTVSKLRLDRLLNQNRGFLQSVPIHLACIESFQEKKKKARLPNEFVDCGSKVSEGQKSVIVYLTSHSISSSCFFNLPSPLCYLIQSGIKVLQNHLLDCQRAISQIGIGPKALLDGHARCPYLYPFLHHPLQFWGRKMWFQWGQLWSLLPIENLFCSSLCDSGIRRLN